jgi:hypothetical protein
MRSWRPIAIGLVAVALMACGGGAPPARTTGPTQAQSTSSHGTATDAGGPTAGETGAPGEFVTCHPGWTTTAQNCSIHIGDKLSVSCPPSGTIRYAWGTDTYTADSSVCTAAVHAGRIGVDAGGEVYVQIQAGQEHYDGSERNGVTTADRGDWLTSFVFIDGPQ